MKRRLKAILEILLCDTYFISTETKAKGKEDLIYMDSNMSSEKLEALSGITYSFYYHMNKTAKDASEIINNPNA